MLRVFPSPSAVICRALCLVLVAICHLSSAICLQAATVTHTFLRPDGSAYTNTVIFRPARDSAVLVSPSITAYVDTRVTPSTNGAIAATLRSGNYNVVLGATRMFAIAVPDSTNSYELTALLTGDALTTAAIPTVSTVGDATSGAGGKVRTDVTESGPIVYTKASADALLAAKLATTNGTARGLTLAGTAAYDLADESALVFGVDYGMSLDVGLTSTSMRARVRSVPDIGTLTNSVSPLTGDLFSKFTVLGAQGGEFKVVLATGITNDFGVWFPSVVNTNYAFQRITNGLPVRPEWWGAVANDFASDSTAIQSAINYNFNANGGIVELDFGQYDIDSTPVLKYRTSLRGMNDNRPADLLSSASSSTNRLMSSSTVIHLMAGANCKMLVGDPTAGYVRQAAETWEDGSGPFDSLQQSSSIEGITFDGNGFNQTTYDCDGLNFIAKWSISVKNCSFYNVAGYAARFLDVNYLRWQDNTIVGGAHPAMKGMLFWGSADGIITHSTHGGTVGPTTWVAGSTSGKNLFSDLLLFNARRTNSSWLVTNIASGVFTTDGNHYLATGDPVAWVTTGTLPTGLTASGISWAVRLSSNTFGVNPVWMGATNSVYTNTYSAGSGNLYATVGPASGLYQSDSAGNNNITNLRADQNSGPGGVYLHGSLLTEMASVFIGETDGVHNSETNTPSYGLIIDGGVQNSVLGLSLTGQHGGVLFTNGAAGNNVLLNSFNTSVTNSVTDNTVGGNNRWDWYDLHLGRQVFAGTTLLSNAAPILKFVAGNGASGGRVDVTGGPFRVTANDAATTLITLSNTGDATVNTIAVGIATVSTNLLVTGPGTFTGALVQSNAAPVFTAVAANGISGLVFDVFGGDANNMVRFRDSGGSTIHAFGNSGGYVTGGNITADTFNPGGTNDTTLGRAAPGVLTVEGNAVPSPSLPSTGNVIVWTNSAWSSLPIISSTTIAPTYVSAGAIPPFATAGATAATTTLATTGISIDEYAFDASTDEKVGAFHVAAPSGWNGTTLTAEFVWRSTATTGNCVWTIAARLVRDGDQVDSAFGTAVSVTDGTAGTANYQNISAASGTITPSGTYGAGCQVYFIVTRDADNGSDTLSVDALLGAVKINWQ
jgi:hypothetical protein